MAIRDGALRIAGGHAALEMAMDWSGYDLLRIDTAVDGDEPFRLAIEIRDRATVDYWTRVNLSTIVPPGRGSLAIPLRQLYVGEKSRPGRMLRLAEITRLVIGRDAPGELRPLVVDGLSLERDPGPERAAFPGLVALDLGTATSPVMDGFARLTPAARHAPGRDHGWIGEGPGKAHDALQPDPLHQDFILVREGELALAVPDGAYRIHLNLESPGGYWGEWQAYSRRTLAIQGRTVLDERQDFAGSLRRYFRGWDAEDLPGMDVFDAYQRDRFPWRSFDAQAEGGQLRLRFSGDGWGCCVSAVVAYPIARAAEGEAFLRAVGERRRFYFGCQFKAMPRRPAPLPPALRAQDEARGLLLFARDPMQEVHVDDIPRPEELVAALDERAFAGEIRSLSLGVLPMRDLGGTRIAVSDLTCAAGVIPARAWTLGHVVNRLTRVTMEGSLYTIAPRLVMPMPAVDCPRGRARRFWLTIAVPDGCPPGAYRGTIAVSPSHGDPVRIPLSIEVLPGTLDEVDIPVGPFGHAITAPWVDEAEPAAAAFRDDMTRKSLAKLREYGFNLVTGMPAVAYRGWSEGRPALDYVLADAQMRLARELGFRAVVSYGDRAGVLGLGPYRQDGAAMRAAGFQDYSAFIRAVYGAVEEHARAAGWLPVYWNLCDEPLGDDLVRATENAEAYRRAFPQGPPFFTGASSFTGGDAGDAHFRLARALHVANWTLHDEAGTALIRRSGSDWAMYNGGSRWTVGDYMFKAVSQHGMRFRVLWHWNVVAGDPYYALDCREDDFAWCNATPDGRLVPSLTFERLREGLNDYRRLLTLSRLVERHAGSPEAEAGRRLLAERMGSFRLGQCDHDVLFGTSDWLAFRRRVEAAICALRPASGR